MGMRETDQSPLWIAASDLPASPGHPFYARLNAVLDAHGFDRFAEDQCREFYAKVMGRPSLPPGQYFRLLLVGYFEGIDAERGIDGRHETPADRHLGVASTIRGRAQPATSPTTLIANSSATAARRGIAADTALRLKKLLKASQKFWMNLHARGLCTRGSTRWPAAGKCHRYRSAWKRSGPRAPF